MTDAEYHEFYLQASRAFEQVKRMFDTSSEDRNEKHRVWRAALDDVRIEDARAVIVEIASGKLQRPEFFSWSDLPKLLRERCKEIERDAVSYSRKPEYVEGHRVYRCRDCFDVGYRTVWHPSSVRHALDGDAIGSPRTRDTAAVVCPRQREDKCEWQARYDAATMLLTDRLAILRDGMDDDDQRPYREFLDGLHDKRMESREWQADAEQYAG